MPVPWRTKDTNDEIFKHAYDHRWWNRSASNTNGFFAQKAPSFWYEFLHSPFVHNANWWGSIRAVIAKRHVFSLIKMEAFPDALAKFRNFSIFKQVQKGLLRGHNFLIESSGSQLSSTTEVQVVVIWHNWQNRQWLGHRCFEVEDARWSICTTPSWQPTFGDFSLDCTRNWLVNKAHKL